MAEWTPVINLAELDGASAFRISRILGTPDAPNYKLEGLSGNDWNGDGFDDISFFEVTDGEIGALYIIYGNSLGFPDIDLGQLDSDQSGEIVTRTGLFSPAHLANGNDAVLGIRFDGVTIGDALGFSGGSAGDINGDGIDDLVVSAIAADPDGTPDAPVLPNAGVTYIIFGTTAPPPGSFSLADLDGVNGFRIDGAAAGDYSGWSVDGAGDINGDGFGDLIIGAYRADPTGGDRYSYNGSTYIVFGSGDPFAPSIDLADLDGTNGFRVDGLASLDRTGRRVAGLGDVNGDGLADIIISAKSADPGGRNGAGESYVIFGSTTPFSATFDLAALDGSNGFRIEGAAANDNSGSSVASAGDLNGDGFDDIIVGAEGVDLDGPAGFGYQGAAYVIFGSGNPFAATVSLGALDGSNGFRLRGDAQDGSSQTGYSVASAGDVNGDGFDDLLIGALRARSAPNQPPSGAVFVVFGSAAPFAADFNFATLDGTNGFRINAVSTLDYAGSSVDSAGDINGDGFDDILINAFGTTESYVIYGRAPAEAVNRTGTNADQSLAGGALDDTFSGMGGMDRLHGNGGNDTAEFTGAQADYRVSALGDGRYEIEDLRAGSPDGTDTLSGIELVRFGGGAPVAIADAVTPPQTTGSPGDDNLTGSDGNDNFFLQQGGDDQASGGPGNDGFYFGGALTGADGADGGPDIDTLAIQGNYPALVLGGIGSIEVLYVAPGDDTQFGDAAGNFYDYVVTTIDANVAPGGVLTVVGGNLRPGEDLTFDGSAESDGLFRIFAGQALDNLVGGGGSDGFFFGANGNMTGADRVDGNGNIDSIALRGNYFGPTAVLFDDASFADIEVMTFLSGWTNEFGGFIDVNGFDYDITLADGNVTAGMQLDIIATTLRANESARVDARAELDGSVRVLAGASDDVIFGGINADTFYGGFGADAIDGGGGSDLYIYRATAESTSASRDTLTFTAGDRIQLSFIDADGDLGANDAFDFIGDAAFSNVAGQLRAFQSAGQWIIEGDTNGDGVAELVIAVNSVEPISVAEFVL